MLYFLGKQEGLVLLLIDSQSIVFLKLCLHGRLPIIRLGLIINNRIGIRCIVINIFSRVNDGVRLLMWWGVFPRCVMINIYIEYRAVISMLIPMKIIVKFDHVNDDMMIASSPIKLMVGGSARFVRLAMIHQVPIKGRITCMPRASVKVRLCTRS